MSALVQGLKKLAREGGGDFRVEAGDQGCRMTLELPDVGRVFGEGRTSNQALTVLVERLAARGIDPLKA